MGSYYVTIEKLIMTVRNQDPDDKNFSIKSVPDSEFKKNENLICHDYKQ